MASYNASKFSRGKAASIDLSENRSSTPFVRGKNRFDDIALRRIHVGLLVGGHLLLLCQLSVLVCVVSPFVGHFLTLQVLVDKLLEVAELLFRDLPLLGITGPFKA